jgi:hypothetical protein
VAEDRTAQGDLVGVRVLGDEPVVGGPDVGLQVGGERLFPDPGADLLTTGGEFVDVLDVEALEGAVDPVVEAVDGEEPAEGVGGGGETTGDAHAGVRQVDDHLAEGGVLSADLGDIVHADFGEPENVC